MPLIIICGTPVSGKTTRAKELKSYFENERRKSVNIVSEDDAILKLGYDKNSAYLDSQKEKRIRGYLKSEAIKFIGKDNVVILDGSNYIKGYRYELYCASKASKSTQCTVYTICNHEDAWQANKQRSDEGSDKDINVTAYSEEVFNALTKLRFEEPNSNNRWDSPLFTVQPCNPLDCESIYRVLFERKPPPPNMSTQNPPKKKPKKTRIETIVRKRPDIKPKAAHCEDDLDAFGKYVISSLRSLHPKHIIDAQDEIQRVLSKYKHRNLEPTGLSPLNDPLSRSDSASSWELEEKVVLDSE